MEQDGIPRQEIDTGKARPAAVTIRAIPFALREGLHLTHSDDAVRPPDGEYGLMATVDAQVVQDAGHSGGAGSAGGGD